MVDDLYAFYDSGAGKGQEGTLAVVDLQGLLDKKRGLSELSRIWPVC